jgi:hypothetical protein
MRRGNSTLPLILVAVLGAAAAAAQQGDAGKAAMDEIARARDNLRPLKLPTPATAWKQLKLSKFWPLPN